MKFLAVSLHFQCQYYVTKMVSSHIWNDIYLYLVLCFLTNISALCVSEIGGSPYHRHHNLQSKCHLQCQKKNVGYFFEYLINLSMQDITHWFYSEWQSVNMYLPNWHAMYLGMMICFCQVLNYDNLNSHLFLFMLSNTHLFRKYVIEDSAAM